MNKFSMGDEVRLYSSELGLDEGRLIITVPEGSVGTVVEVGVDGNEYLYAVRGNGFEDVFYEDEMEVLND